MLGATWPDIDENRRVKSAENRNAIFRLHQQQVAVTKPEVLERSQRGLCPVGADIIGAERFQSAAAAERVEHVERHIRAGIGAREEAMQRQTLTGSRIPECAAEVRFPTDGSRAVRCRDLEPLRPLSGKCLDSGPGRQRPAYQVPIIGYTISAKARYARTVGSAVKPGTEPAGKPSSIEGTSSRLPEPRSGL